MRTQPLFPSSAQEKVGHLDGPHADRLHLLDGLPPRGPEWSDPTIIRQVDLFDAPVEPVDLPDVERTDAQAHGPHGPVPLRVYTPYTLQPLDAHGRRGAVLWIHGGAFIGGNLEMPEADHTAARLAHGTGLPVVSVDYRLCLDGVHHPVPHDDCWAAYQWVREGGLSSHLDSHLAAASASTAGVVVGGASAGATLAASVGLHGRDAGCAPEGVLLVYPVEHYPVPELEGEDAALVAALPPALTSQPGGHGGLMSNYLGPDMLAIEHPGYALPGQADSLAGFPRNFVENCELDELRASGEAFTRQLEEAGVDVEQHTVPGEIHGHLNVPGLPSARRTCEHAVAFVRDVLGLGASGASPQGAQK